jgi:spore germination cell wall hydrolase CwlJ-like protein
MAQQADAHVQTQRLAAAAARGFSESALRDEAGKMDPGALAVARRHDPFTVAGAAERDRETAIFVGQALPATRGMASPPVLRASFNAPSNPQARPFHLGGGALESARDLDCLTDAVYYEARGEGSAGQAAVAQVVLNRVRHPAFPKSVCGVVFQGAQVGDTCQFSFACDGSMRRPREPGAWQRAQQVAAHALAGFVMPSVGNATHFHAAGIEPGWGPHLLRVAQIGLHVFYRFGGYAGGPGSFNAHAERSTGSEMAVRPVYASLTQSGGVTADGRQAAQYILADAIVDAPVAAKAAAPTGPQAASASAAGKDSAAVIASARPLAGATAHAEGAPTPRVDAPAKPDPTAQAGKLATTAAS